MAATRKGREKRKNLRIRTRAWVRAEFDGQMRPIRDLSTTGIFVRMPKPPKEGTHVDVLLHSVRLPDPVKLSGIVRRSVPDSGMGVEIEKFRGPGGQINLSDLLSDLIVPRILVACREENIRRDLNRLFNKEGFAILLAPDGKEALHLAEESQLDLILLDMDMKGVTGLDVLKKFRANKSLDNVPIIAMSGSDDPHILGEAQKLGVTGTVPKPLKTQRVLNFIRMMLER